MNDRFVGVDIGAETLKLVELVREEPREPLRLARCHIASHQKDPAAVLLPLLDQWEWPTVTSAAICGRLARSFQLTRVPEKQARAAGFRFVHDDEPVTLVSIGSHGFSVLELRGNGTEVFRENSRCSQGTGNFLRQLVERFGLTVEEASVFCADVEDPTPLSGRCPVILKTDMTHLANLGQSHDRILAGLYDAVAANVEVLVKPRSSPSRVVLLGGVTRAPRIREHFRRHLEREGMTLLEVDERSSLFIDAIGCAVVAAEMPRGPLPALHDLFAPLRREGLEVVPALSGALSRIRRLPFVRLPDPSERPADPAGGLIVGLDIGSTGSKAVAIDASDGAMVWQAYGATGGNPVAAAQGLVRRYLEGPFGMHPVRAFGVTGSGREIVGSLLLTCFGAERVFVLNEIAAHAEGALSFDPRVDTIFEIGGQDAKYIRLAEGRVVDAAMNEACSAGTGSFIEEQGKQFSGIGDVVQLGRVALEADAGVSLGQHCSVFMAEIIDEAAAAGVEQHRIVAGIYDSIIQNYLNRVKGSRSVGEVIFCQGMPFSADALAAAVARQTGAEVVVPPNPGTIGALGIALLTRRERKSADAPLDARPFLGAEVLEKDHFACKSTKGCGGAGNKCRIERLRTLVEGKRQRFTWGGGCSLYDRGTGRVKLPDGAPDPFREREELVDAIAASLPANPEGERIVITDEFVLKGTFPFFATFLAKLGYRLDILRGADQKILKRGIEEANVPFCAPMQIYHGAVSALADREHDWLFLPMVLSTPPVGDQARSVLCPMVQSSADLNRWDLAARRRGNGARILSPVIDLEGGWRSPAFKRSLVGLLEALGRGNYAFETVFEEALHAQVQFDRQCRALGQRALVFCAERELIPVVVLGRPYTIYNHVLNSNVPAILREQGAVAIPVDCYPTEDDVPTFEHMYWGYGQRNLRAAHQIRRTPGTYSLWCSNYSCGPDSFTLHFYGFLMEGKPYSVIETDGHSGDAGTRTRVEAFLHCVREDLRAAATPAPESRAAGRAVGQVASQARRPARDLRRIECAQATLSDIQARGERVLIPRMSPAAEAVAACLSGAGVPTECLPEPDREALALGRRHTSGKECMPMAITLGSLLKRIQAEPDPDQRFAFFMPSARGPCRFGSYNVLHKIVLERLGLSERVRVWSPKDDNYFEGIPAGITGLVFAGVMAADMLQAALYDVRPAESRPGAAQEIYDRSMAELCRIMRRGGAGDLSVGRALAETTRGTFFGCTELLKSAAAELAAVKRAGELPTILVVGEIYVRCDPFANDFAIDRLQAQGVRVRLAPFNEWLDYQEYINTLMGVPHDVGSWLSAKVQAYIQHRSYQIMSEALGWPPLMRARHSIEAAAPYIRHQAEGEAALTLGGALYEWRSGHIDGVLSVAPLECMPSRVAEAQFFHAAEREGVRALTMELNGDPVDQQILDNFVFELRDRFGKRREREHAPKKEPNMWVRMRELGREIGRGFPKPDVPAWALVPRRARAPQGGRRDDA
ncbi:MAG: CoA activase [Deltaproteobacteria bacterium]|nr:CoA activase [Deltaproteobacteria bacterium]